MLKHTCKEVDSHPLTPIPLPPKVRKKSISPKAAWKNVTFTGCGTGLGGCSCFWVTGRDGGMQAASQVCKGEEKTHCYSELNSSRGSKGRCQLCCYQHLCGAKNGSVNINLKKKKKVGWGRPRLAKIFKTAWKAWDRAVGENPSVPQQRAIPAGDTLAGNLLNRCLTAGQRGTSNKNLD